MTAQRPAPRKTTRQLVVMGLMAACLTPLALPTLPAAAAPGYRPPRRQSGQRTESTGTRSAGSRIGNLRGCAKDLAVPLTLLMPDHTAQTTMGQPPLFLYLAKPKQLSITFYEIPATGGRKLLWRRSVKAPQSGIIQIPFPTDRPAVEVGKTYAWGAALVCNPQNPSELTSATESKFTRVAPSAWLQSKLKTAQSPQRKAQLYAGSSYWLDTLNATAEALATNTDDSAEKDLLDLLEQIKLTDIVKREQAASAAAAATQAAQSKPTGDQPTAASTRDTSIATEENTATPDNATKGNNATDAPSEAAKKPTQDCEKSATT
ncbi:DUF928 domain-containing protein [filamentous cyanobacterium LEGE 11480]|uniref:DUF928 domain-containing protein n=1 Tax=Romeriopsis navalis LEGE 11480 TaxID=2777977 RepID=A0A928VRH5_9CYAN|nr:DUF928 domain-containing protein [Romeriopsis navalis]MBE9031240.1 DUF928 domain-containing protein [Romeriopsis navalis LEGE 11480]